MTVLCGSPMCGEAEGTMDWAGRGPVITCWRCDPPCCVLFLSRTEGASGDVPRAPSHLELSVATRPELDQCARRRGWCVVSVGRSAARLLAEFVEARREERPVGFRDRSILDSWSDAFEDVLFPEIKCGRWGCAEPVRSRVLFLQR